MCTAGGKRSNIFGDASLTDPSQAIAFRGREGLGEFLSRIILMLYRIILRPDLMRDRKRKTAFFDLDFSIRKKKLSYLRPDLMRDRKRKTAFFDLDFSIRKKSFLILRKAIYFFLVEKSRSKNAVFRFRYAFSISHKIGP